MNVNLFIIEDYRKKDDFVVRINKPNFQNAKMSANLYFIEDYENETASGSKKTKPNKPNSNPMGFQIPSINGQDRLIFCSGKYSLDVPAFAGKQADVIIFPENRQDRLIALFAWNL